MRRDASHPRGFSLKLDDDVYEERENVNHEWDELYVTATRLGKWDTSGLTMIGRLHGLNISCD